MSLMKTKVIACTAAIAIISFVYTKLEYSLVLPSLWNGPEDTHHCHAPLLQWDRTKQHRYVADHPAVRLASRNLREALDKWFDEGDMDSMAIAVVDADGSIYEGFWGALRANESDKTLRGAVDRNTVYRLASISKLFTATETLILRDRGVLNLDDPLTKIFPDLKHVPDDEPMTIRQLMSHMSGTGRDWPPGSATGAWPEFMDGTGPPWYNGLPFPSHDDFMAGIAQNPLVVPPYTFPVYSNTGYSLLGLTNVAANKKVEGDNAPSTHADLLRRDIFLPLGFNSTSFAISETNKENAAISSVLSMETDIDFGDATNPAGGQMSSLSDLVVFMQTLIDPSRPNRLLRPSTVREWMRPTYGWSDGYSGVGVLWEVYQLKDSYRRKLSHYQKLGLLAGHHTIFTINPTSSFGVIVLTTGPTMQVIPLNELIFSHFQRAFDIIAEEMTNKLLTGRWASADGLYEVTIVIDAGSLFVSRYTINGTDVLKAIQPDGVARRTALWSTVGDEFRLAVELPNSGCSYHWEALDQYAYKRGFPMNLLRLVEEGDGFTLQLPAAGVALKRS